MNFEQIEIILDVAEKLSFAEAAYDLSVSVSTVSRAVKAVEDEIGIMLFKRWGKSKVQCTAEGEELLPYFQSLQDTKIQLFRASENMTSRGVLHIECMPHLNVVETMVLRNLMDVNPDYDAFDDCDPDSTAARKVMLGKADIALTTYFGPLQWHPVLAEILSNPEVGQRVIAKEPGYVILNRRHPLARKSVICMEDIFALPNPEIFFASFSNEYARAQCIALEKWTAERDRKLTIKQLSTQSHFGGEMLNMYVTRHANSFTIARDLLLRNDDCIKIPFQCEELQFTTIAYYLRSNHSKMLKEFKQALDNYTNENKENGGIQYEQKARTGRPQMGRLG